MLWVLICRVHLTICSCHVTYAFQSESTHSESRLAKVSVRLWTNWLWVWVQLQSLNKMLLITAKLYFFNERNKQHGHKRRRYFNYTAFTNLQMDFIFSIWNYCEKKRNDIQNIFLLETSGKYKVVNRTLAVGYGWKYFLYSFILK